jgi:hypothetical protein
MGGAMEQTFDSPEAIDAGTPTNVERVLSFCTGHINEFKRKADHNKNESLRCFVLVIASTLAAPLFVTLGPEWISGKLIPSILSLLAAGATAWLQLRKPQQLWSLYRTAERQLEDHKNRFEYNLTPYSEGQAPDKLLASNVADIVIGVHYKWIPLIPSPDHFQKTQSFDQVPASTDSVLKHGRKISPHQP